MDELCMRGRKSLVAAILFCTIWVSPLMSQNSPNFEALSKALEQSYFTAVSTQDLDVSRSNVLVALSEVSADFTPNEWKDVEGYLRTKDVSIAIQTNAANVEDWLVILSEKVNSDSKPNEKPKLLRLRAVLRRHLQLLDDSRKGNEIESRFNLAIQTFRDALHRFEKSGSTAEHDRISTEIRWCVEHSFAGDFVRLAKLELSNPNLEIYLPADFIRIASTQRMDKTETINRNSDGIETRGSGDFRAKGFLEPASCGNSGALIMRLQGDAKFSAVNTRKKIQFRSFATTNIFGCARITINDLGLMTTTSPEISATTNVINCEASVDLFVGKRLIGRVADRAIAKKTPEIEDTLTREIADRLKDELRNQLGELIGKANTFTNGTLWPMARRLELAPRRLSIQTTIEEMRLTATEDTVCGLAAPFPFKRTAERSCVAALHQSFATDLLNSTFVRQSRPESLNANSLQHLNDSMPIRLFREAKLRDEGALLLILDFPRPFVITFHDEVASLTMRAKELRLLDKSHPPHDVTISYRIAKRSDGGMQFTLEGHPTIAPVGGLGSKANPELVEAVQNDLFGDLLPTFYVSADKLGMSDFPIKIRISGVLASQGWLALSLDQPQLVNVAPPILSAKKE